jgi:hypothetical protein
MMDYSHIMRFYYFNSYHSFLRRQARQQNRTHASPNHYLYPSEE